MPGRVLRYAVAAALLGTVLLCAGCWWSGSGGDRPAPTPAETTSTPPAETESGGSASPAKDTSVLVYFIDSAEKVVPVRRTVTAPAVAAGAVKALLAGPTAAEKAAGLRTLVPEGTELLGVRIQGSTAVVDLSDDFSSGGGTLSMSARVAQMVFTLTQFSTVDDVTFEMNGKPLTVLGGEGIVLETPQTRADWEDFAPAVLFEAPVFGDSAKSPLRVRGSANIFEAVFNVDVVDGSGATVATQRVTATSGTGTRGTFDVTVTWPRAAAGNGKIVAWYESPKDGSRVEVALVPVKF